MRVNLVPFGFALGCLALFQTVTAAPLAGKKSTAEIIAETTAADWRRIDADNTLYIELEAGRVVVELLPELAPEHIKQIRLLAREGVYDGLSFYRVIGGVVAQGGDPFSTRDIGSAAPQLLEEFEIPYSKAWQVRRHVDADGYASVTGWLKGHPIGIAPERGFAWGLHCTGAFAFGRNEARNSASTEFYITLQPQRYLDRNLTVFGRVIDGMTHLQRLRRVAPPETQNDDVGEVIKSIRIASELPETERTDFEILDSRRDAFGAYVEARRNRPEAFFYERPNFLDICQLPPPIRRVAPTSAAKAANAPDTEDGALEAQDRQ